MRGGPWILAVSWLVGSPVARAGADEVAYTCDVRPTGGAVIVAAHDGQACTGFEVRVGRTLTARGRLGFRGSGVFLGTRDGRTVIFVQSSPYTIASGDLTTLPGVVFFRDGRKVASYAIAELLERPRLVSLSTSHTQWVSGKQGGHEAALELLGATWTLYTSSFRRIEFDVETGRMLSAGDTDLWKSCERIAGGEIERRGEALRIARPFAVKGEVPSPLSAAIPPGAPFDEGASMVCLSAASGSLRLIRTIGRYWLLDGADSSTSRAR